MYRNDKVIRRYSEPFKLKNLVEITTERIDAIITRSKGQVRADLMDKLTHLRVISRCGVG